MKIDLNSIPVWFRPFSPNHYVVHAPESCAGDATGPSDDDQAAEFIEVILKDTENVWTQLFDEYVEAAR